MNTDDILSKDKAERTPEELEFLKTADLTPAHKAILEMEGETPGDTGTVGDDVGEGDSGGRPPGTGTIGDSGTSGDTGTPGDTGAIETPEQKAARLERENKGIREEHRLVREQNQSLVEQLAEVEEIPDPTEEQLKSYEPDWDSLSDFEKRAVKRSWKQDQRSEQIHKIALATKNDLAWNKQLDRFVDESEAKDEHPEIVKNREEFIKFATKKTHRGVDPSILADAFVTHLNRNKPTGDTGTPGHRSVFEPGNGGGREKVKQPKKNTYTPEILDNIRRTDSKRYRELVMDGTVGKVMESAASEL